MPAFINLKWPLKKFMRGFYQGNESTIAAVTEDIKVLLLTSKGERVINTDMGTNLPVFSGELFQNVSKAEMSARIRTEIIEALETWMPHVKLVDIKIFTTEDEGEGLGFNQIRIKMNYVLTDFEAIGDSVQITLG